MTQLLSPGTYAHDQPSPNNEWKGLGGGDGGGEGGGGGIGGGGVSGAGGRGGSARRKGSRAICEATGMGTVMIFSTGSLVPDSLALDALVPDVPVSDVRFLQRFASPEGNDRIVTSILAGALLRSRLDQCSCQVPPSKYRNCPPTISGAILTMPATDCRAA